MSPSSVGGPLPEWVTAVVAVHAREQPDAPVVLTETGETLTWATLHDQAAAMADQIRALSGLGSTVVLAVPSGPSFVRCLVAGLVAGARVLLVHPKSPATELEGLARRAGARAMLREDGVVALHHGPESRDRESMAGAILPSSGTTGAPKLVLREADALRADAINVARALAIGPGDRLLAAVPLGHSYGLDMTLAALWSGATLVTHAEFDAGMVARSLAEGVTVFPAVPFMIEALARAGPGRRPTALRLVFTAGTPLPAPVREAFVATWGTPVGQLYGATELGSVTLSDPAEPGFAPDSVGRPFPGVTIRIVNPDDARCSRPVGEEGHIAVAAPSMLTRYLDADTPLVDGHLLTGDLGRVDPEGRLFVTGRLKLLIDVGGLKVNPLEVEAVLREHPAVAECVVLPMALSETVTRLRAVYTARAAARPEELRRFLRERLSPHKVPRVFESVAALPRSPSGKVLRHAGGSP